MFLYQMNVYIQNRYYQVCSEIVRAVFEMIFTKYKKTFPRQQTESQTITFMTGNFYLNKICYEINLVFVLLKSYDSTTKQNN